jgi:hypothetical protein
MTYLSDEERSHAIREELKRRLDEAYDEFIAQGGQAPDTGRQIPPWMNLDVPGVVNAIEDCYAGLTKWMVGFRQTIVELVRDGKLDPAEEPVLLEYYDRFQKVIEAALAITVPVSAAGPKISEITSEIHRVADHAKYVYAMGSRDIAVLQYRLAELAGTGRLDTEAHEHLQWDHCLGMWQTLYYGTTSVLHDPTTWDGQWDWNDNTYSDGRQVTVQIRPTNWLEAERNWPYNEGMCGDGPLQEYPWASVSEIAPPDDPDPESRGNRWIAIDLDYLNRQIAMVKDRGNNGKKG